MSVNIVLYVKAKNYKDVKRASLLLSYIVNGIYYWEEEEKYAFSYVRYSINNTILSNIDEERYLNLLKLRSIRNNLSYNPDRKEMLYLIEGSMMGNCSFYVGNSNYGSFIKKNQDKGFYSINLFDTSIFRRIYSSFDYFDAYYGVSLMDARVIGKPMSKYIWY